MSNEKSYRNLPNAEGLKLAVDGSILASMVTQLKLGYLSSPTPERCEKKRVRMVCRSENAELRKRPLGASQMNNRGCLDRAASSENAALGSVESLVR